MKTRTWKQTAAVAARRRKAAKAARVRRETVHAKRERRRRRHKSQIAGAWALTRPRWVETHLARQMALERANLSSRKVEKTQPLVLLPPPQRWLPEWKPNLWKDEPMEATKAA